MVVSLHSSERVVIGGFEFTLDSPTGNRVFRDGKNDFSIEVDHRVFLADAESVLKTLRNRVGEIRKIRPAHFYIGAPSPPEMPLASMDEQSGTVRFYRDDYGGLLSVGYFHSVDPNRVPERLDELLLHECSHGLQRRDDVKNLIKDVADVLVPFFEGGGVNQEVGEQVMADALALHSDFIRQHIAEMIASRQMGRIDDTTHYTPTELASEFWAEACTAKFMGLPVQQGSPKTPALIAMCHFIDLHLDKLDAVDSTQLPIMHTMSLPNRSTTIFESARFRGGAR